MTGSDEAKFSWAAGISPEPAPCAEEGEAEPRFITDELPAPSASPAPLLDCSDLEAQLQSLVEQMRAREHGCLVTKEGRVVTYPLAESSELVLIDGPEAWQFHDNPRYADCILEVPGLPKMHACAAYLSLRSSFFEALFSSDFSEAHTRVVTVRPPSPSAFLLVLPFLYTGELPCHTLKQLRASLTNSPSEFWSVWETASFLGCPQLLDTCSDILARDVSEAPAPYKSDVEGKMQPWPLKPLFDHDYFTADNIGTKLDCLLRRLVKHRPAATVAVLLAALKDHTGPTMPKDLELVAVQLRRDPMVSLDLAALERVLEDYPAAAHHLFPPSWWLKKLQSERRDKQAQMDETRRTLQAEIKDMKSEMETTRCIKCKLLVPAFLEDEPGQCRYLGHPGDYCVYRKDHPVDKGGWSCCGKARKRDDGCEQIIEEHEFSHGRYGYY